MVNRIFHVRWAHTRTCFSLSFFANQIREYNAILHTFRIIRTTIYFRAYSARPVLLARVARIKRKSAHENENCAVSFARSMTLTKQTNEGGINFSGQRFQSHCELRRLPTTRIVETNAPFEYSGWNYPHLILTHVYSSSWLRSINMSVRIDWGWFHPENLHAPWLTASFHFIPS